MKILTILLTLTFTVMFSSPSFADWKKVNENVKATFYVDFERIRKHGGYVYYWILIDRLKPNKHGDLSEKAYQQGDCKLFRFKGLNFSSYKEPLGEGTGVTKSPPDKWIYRSLQIAWRKSCSVSW